MRRILSIYCAVVTLLLIATVKTNKTTRSENQRLKSNISALTSQMSNYRTKAGKSAVTIEALRLSLFEMQTQARSDTEKIRSLGWKLRDLEATSQPALSTEIRVYVPLRDTVLIRDTVRLFEWSDAWTRVEGEIVGDSVGCHIRSVDTLWQVVHREPRKFLFFRWGTKSLRQDIVWANPNSSITYTKYIRVERR